MRHQEVIDALDHAITIKREVLTCPCGFACSLKPDSSGWHRAHLFVHLEVFPHVDLRTRMNLATMIAVHEQRERETTMEQAEQRKVG